MEFLNEVSIEFPETKEFIEERLEHKYSEENISQEEVIYLFIYLFYEPRSNNFLLHNIRFSSRNLHFY